MQKEKLQRKKKAAISENKENQNPNNNLINENQLGNKNLDSLRIQIEGRNKAFIESDFLNSEKSLNLNSKDSNLNKNVKNIENCFAGKHKFG